MGEKEDKEKAEKLAAAKKRVAQLQKKKKAAGSGTSEKTTDTAVTKGKGKKKQDKEKEEDAAGDDPTEDGDDIEPKDEIGDVQKEELAKVEAEAEAPETTSREPLEEEDDPDEDTAAFNDAIKAANEAAARSDSPTQVEASDSIPSPTTLKTRQHPGRQQSISLQSKMRSTSFRSGPLSPTGLQDEGSDSMYRKQALRIEELERENQRLAEGEARWRKTEEELEELREQSVDQTIQKEGDDEVAKLQAEIEALRRSQRQSLSAGTGKGRQGSTTLDESELKKELENKDSTISDLQLEISRLRSQVSSQTEGSESRDEQVTALQSSLERAETRAKKLETELSDNKKALSRASEKAVVDGTERTSKDTKIRSLEKENEDVRTERDELKSKTDGLEKKIEAMNKLHRETEDRSSKKLATAEAQARDVQALRARVESHEKEISRLREAKKRTMSGSGGDDGLDELEDEERKRLERKIRDLEGELFELRRGVWRDKRKEMQPGMTSDGGDEFDDVDLNGSMPISRRRSSTSRQSHGAGMTRHSGFTQVLNSGLAAFRGSTASPDTQQQQQQRLANRPRNDSLLQEFDDDDDAFDMGAFAAAQREEEMKKMVEHVKEVKRGLKQWVGWRLDLVDSRRGGGGIGVGEVFEI